MNETMRMGLELAGVGLMVVFSVLTIMALVVTGLQRLDARWQAAEAAQDDARTEAEPTIDATTLVIISAAVFTVFQGRAHIKKVRRLLPSENPSTAWSMQGRLSVQGSHVIPRNEGQN